MVTTTTERLTTGVLQVTKKGLIEVHCARCCQATTGITHALGVFEDNETFLRNPNPGWNYTKRHGVYDPIRNSPFNKSPAIGSKLRCQTCQWINIVPNPRTRFQAEDE